MDHLRILIGGFLAVGTLHGCDKPAPNNAPAVVDTEKDAVPRRAQEFYATLPDYQQPLATAKAPPQLTDISAETCGACHQEIYREWSISTHRRAWLDDPQFQAELAKSRGEGSSTGDVSWMCVNCHTPLTNQMEQLVVGLRDGKLDQPIYAPNPTFDRKLQLEAITCATCHVRDGVIRGPWGDNTYAPHAVVKSDDLVSEVSCTRCHQAEATFPEIDLGCFFGTGEEFAQSPAAAEGKVCQSCHMPEVERKVAEAFDVPVRKTRRHWFGGSLIPKQPRYEAELAPLRAIYGDGVELTLVPSTPDTRHADHTVPGVETTRCADTGPCTRLAVVVANTNAGHYFPTGDPERHADVEVRALDATGAVIGRASLRIASKFEWWPKMKKLWDNRIPAGKQTAFLLEVPADEPFTVVVEAQKNRMYPDALKHHELEGAVVAGRTFHTSRWDVEHGKVSRKD